MRKVEAKIGENIIDYLINKYTLRFVSSNIIARNLDIDPSTAVRWLHRFGVEVRNPDFYFLKRAKRLSREELYSLYHVEGRTVNEIADIAQVDVKTIYRAMDRYGIERKNGKEKSSNSELFELLQRMSNNNIALRYKVDPRTVRTWKQRAFLHSPKKSKYDPKSERRKALDDILEMTGKNPEELVGDDFARVKKEDGRSYRGVLDWYMSHYGYNFTEAKEHFIKEFYNGAIVR